MSVRRPGLTVAALAASVGLLSACSQEASVLDSAATAPLHERVQAARAALTDNDGAEARQALDAFRTEVRRLSDAGGINADDAQVLVAYSERIDAGIPAGAADRTAESTAPKLVAPRGLGDVTTPALPEQAPARPASPAQQPSPATVPAPQDDEDDDDVVDAPEPDRPEPNDPDPGEEDPGDEDPGNEDPGDEEPAPEDPAPDDPQPDPAPGDTDGASDGAGE